MKVLKILTLMPVLALILILTSLSLHPVSAAVDISEHFSLQHMYFLKMQGALMDYKNIAHNGGWERIPEGPVLKKGDRGERVFLLRERLIASGDLDGEVSEDPYYFDDILEKAVCRFQFRHGLKIDGMAGWATLKELNVSVMRRIRQLELNLQRIMSLPEDMGEIFILVNIPEYMLYVFEDGQKIMEMKVIVGSSNRQTPEFKSEITYLVFNPSWKIPFNIAVYDILPKAKKNPDYLVKNNIRVLEGWGDNVIELDPYSINWSRINKYNFDFRLEQDPGPDNPLGVVKFIFPNKYNVYIHDTPADYLFDETVRAFSFGCIRAEKPVALAEYLLRSNSDWARENIAEEVMAAINGQRKKKVILTRPVPVYIVYWTAWVADDGTIHFRRDIYNKDIYQN